MRGTVAVFFAAVGCGSHGGSVDAPVVVPDSTTLERTPGIYRQTCDGSGAVALDFQTFVDVNDEDQVLRAYGRGADAPPVQTLDLGPLLGLAGTAEADLEDLERVGNRLYVTASHGRKASGQLDRARYRFAAFDLTGAAPSLVMAPIGSTDQLLDQMLVAANWDTPDNAVITALTASSDLGTVNNANLAPENQGTNIEAVASNGSGALLFGFRNPRPSSKAIVVSLTNPDAVVTGQTAHFAGAAQLDLGGLGIRGMAYSATHAAVLVIAGPPGGGGPFKLYKWSGALTESAVAVADITAPVQSAPEAIVAYAGTKDVQIIFDQGDVLISGVQCKDVTVSERRFTDTIVSVD